MSTSISEEFNHDFLESLSHETPFFLFSKKKIQDNFREYQRYFPGAQIQYAMKANSEPEVLQEVLDIGAGFEVASAHELKMLKEINVPPERIIYGTSVKPISHIKEFFDYGVDRFAFDSLSELEKIAAVAPGSRVYVRIVVNDTGSVFRFSEKFGTDKENAVSLLQRAKELGLHPYGISFHVGSQASNPMAWANALEGLAPVLEHLKKTGIDIEVINIGGGYPCAYASTEKAITLEEIAENTLKQYKKLPYQPQLILEPGRGIIATAAVLVADIIAKVDRSANTWLFLDAGVYDALYEAMAYQGSTRYHVTSMRPSYDSGEALFALAGPTGDSADVITREALLPQDITAGDKLIFHDVGAYSLVVSSRFNGFPKPGVYLI
ncbi:MAG: type III PLP-dependent enzyme [Candidatus Andersenbacteria bacterium]